MVQIYSVLVALGLSFVVSMPQQAQAATPLEPCTAGDFYCPAIKATGLVRALQTFPDPMLPGPGSQQAAADFAISRPISRTILYTTTTKGAVKTSGQDFANRVQAILDDPRGWSRLGMQFQRVEGEGDFTIVLSEPKEVPSFGPPCDTEFNCRVDEFVVVNEARWLEATTPWLGGGGDVLNYQHLAINHELGHWLGHDHPPCPAVAGAAPVMMQQSIELGGCKFNAWPLDAELWSTRLGL